MKRVTLIGALVVIGLSRAAVAQDVLPEGAGRETTTKVCGQCHEAEKAASLKLTRSGWSEEIDKMRTLGAGGTDLEFQDILDYLATQFKGELDRPLDMNSAEAIDLESVLGLLRRESAAFIQYRSRRGPFSSLADIKDLDPAILKKIEAKKERVVFLTPKLKNKN